MMTRISNQTARLETAASLVEKLASAQWEGYLKTASGSGGHVAGLGNHLSLGSRLNLYGRNENRVVAEIVASKNQMVYAMSFSAMDGLGSNALACASFDEVVPGLAISLSWLGRVLDPFGRPLDDRPPPDRGLNIRPVRVPPMDATLRRRLGERMNTGVKAVDLFATCRHGQRLGLFAGSGVGKSTLLGMLARNAHCDVSVIALIGERGREVREFIEDELGPVGLSRSVVVVATSDSSPLTQREAAYSAMTIAEYFRDSGKNVLFIMDSVTRFCHALREIALAAGEPPANRGYPPTVFSELPRFLERAGTGQKSLQFDGFITGFFSVLVEGDDQNEPVADNVRGFLDGHVILNRRISERGRFPAIDVLRSLSRSVPGCNAPSENALLLEARKLLFEYSEKIDLLQFGSYRSGSDVYFDRAVSIAPKIDNFLSQDKYEKISLEESFKNLQMILQ